MKAGEVCGEPRRVCERSNPRAPTSTANSRRGAKKIEPAFCGYRIQNFHQLLSCLLLEDIQNYEGKDQSERPDAVHLTQRVEERNAREYGRYVFALEDDNNLRERRGCDGREDLHEGIASIAVPSQRDRANLEI